MGQFRKDPQRGVLRFRKQIPTCLQAVSGRSSNSIKVSLVTSDRKRIAKP